MSNELPFVPLNKLVRSSLNVRKTGADSIDDLAASIAFHGLLQNLTVTKKSATGKTKSKADTYEVVAGGRRLAALQSLAKQRKIPKDYAVPCKVVTDCAEELSLVENTIRQPMHPADQFEAFHRLVATGLSVEDIAVRFGLTSLFVAQRLKLANVSPTFVQLYRDGGIRLEQLEALAISDDQDAQERCGTPRTSGKEPRPLYAAHSPCQPWTPRITAFSLSVSTAICKGAGESPAISSTPNTKAS